MKKLFTIFLLTIYYLSLTTTFAKDQHLIDSLKKDGSPEGEKEGMDASLICLDKVNNKLIYSTANNRTWILRENSLIVLEPDKIPVGKHDKGQESFTQHEFHLPKWDVIYTLTDGYQDEFWGPKGKKFLSKNLKQLLIANCQFPMEQQKQALESTLINWIDEGEKVDDITILGIKI